MTDDPHTRLALPGDQAAEPITPFLDVRSEAQFLAAHHPAAVNIPLDELAERIHELPPPYESLSIYGNPEQAAQAAAMLAQRDRSVTIITDGEAPNACSRLVSGPSQRRLWRPHRLMLDAVAILRATWGDLAGRHALDIACGAGRDAVYLAEQGLRMAAWDILPDAIQRCTDLARRSGVTVAASPRDATADNALSPDSFDLICCFNFLHRPLIPALARAIRPGGFIVYETFVEPQREQFGKPTRPERVLGRGELARFFQGWRIHITREGLVSPRRIAASLMAQRS